MRTSGSGRVAAASRGPLSRYVPLRTSCAIVQICVHYRCKGSSEPFQADRVLRLPQNRPCRTVASTRHASPRPKLIKHDSLPPGTGLRETRRRSRRELAGRDAKPEALLLLPIPPSCFAVAHTRALLRSSQTARQVSRRSSPLTASTGRVFGRNADRSACHFASTARRCPWARRSPTLAGLSTKSQIAPLSDTSR
jgi:hypothetical protein